MTNFLPELATKAKVITVAVVLVLLAAAFFAGRFTSHPAKVVEKVTDTTQVDSLKTQIATLETKVREQITLNEHLAVQLQTATAVNKTKHTTYRKLPSGEVLIEKIEESKATASTSQTSTTETARTEDKTGEAQAATTTAAQETTKRTVESEKVTTWERPGWRVAGQAGVDLRSLGPLLYQGTVARRLFGTLWVDASVQAGGGSWRVFIGPALEF